MATTQQSKRIPDSNGWWEIKDNPLSKVGVFEYSGRFISPDLDPNKLYPVLRPAEELSDPECIESLRLLPWTNDHPSMLLGPGEGQVRPEDKGIEGVLGEQIYFDDVSQILRGNVKVFSKAHTDRVDAGKIELSLGYKCIYAYEPGTWNGIPYLYVQRKIRGNHFSSVDQGRMGPDVSVLDGLNFTIDHKEFRAMKKTYKVRSIMNALIRYAKDAEETPPTEEKEKGEVEQLQGLIKKISPLMEQLSDLPTIMAKTEMEEETEEDPISDPLALAAKDAEDEAKKEEDAAKAAKDAEEAEAKKDDDEKKGEGMDAKEIKRLIADGIAAAFGAQKPAPVMDAKEVMKEIAKASALASDLSKHVGTFDHSEMSLADVGKYGVDKLGIKNVPAGSEALFLSAYLLDRPVPKASTGFDKKEGELSFVDRHLAGKE